MVIGRLSKKYVLDLLVCLLLVTPQLQVYIFSLGVDSYLVLLALLGWLFVVDFFRGGVFVCRRILLFYIFMLLFVVSLVFVQVAIGEQYSFYSHLRGLLGREEAHIAFGRTDYIEKTLVASELIRFLAVFLLGFLMFYYLSKKPADELLRFFVLIFAAASFFQIFYILLYALGGLEWFLNIAMGGATAAHFSDGVTGTRFGLVRFPGGFSEPSFMAVVLFSSLYSFALGVYLKEKDIRPKVTFFLLAASGFIFLTTASIIMAFVLLFALYLFVVGVHGWRFKVVLICMFFLVVFLQLLPFVFDGGQVPKGLESIIVRQFLVSDVYKLTDFSLIFGFAFAQVYNFPVLNNLILQLGILGALGLGVSFSMLGRFGGWLFVLFVFVLSLSPNLIYSFNYLAIAFALSVVCVYWRGGYGSKVIKEE